MNAFQLTFTCLTLIYVNNRNTGKRCKICSKLTRKTLERRQWRLLFRLLTLSKQMLVRLSLHGSYIKIFDVYAEGGEKVATWKISLKFCQKLAKYLSLKLYSWFLSIFLKASFYIQYLRISLQHEMNKKEKYRKKVKKR